MLHFCESVLPRARQDLRENGNVGSNATWSSLLNSRRLAEPAYRLTKEVVTPKIVELLLLDAGQNSLHALGAKGNYSFQLSSSAISS